MEETTDNWRQPGSHWTPETTPLYCLFQKPNLTLQWNAKDNFQLQIGIRSRVQRHSSFYNCHLIMWLSGIEFTKCWPEIKPWWLAGYSRMFSVSVWWLHGWFCPIRLIYLIGWKSLHFENKTRMSRSASCSPYILTIIRYLRIINLVVSYRIVSCQYSIEFKRDSL